MMVGMFAAAIAWFAHWLVAGAALGGDDEGLMLFLPALAAWVLVGLVVLVGLGMSFVMVVLRGFSGHPRTVAATSGRAHALGPGSPWVLLVAALLVVNALWGVATVAVISSLGPAAQVPAGLAMLSAGLWLGQFPVAGAYGVLLAMGCVDVFLRRPAVAIPAAAPS